MADSLVKKKKMGVVDPTQGVLDLPIETISEVSANETVASEIPKTEEGVEVAETASAPQGDEPLEDVPIEEKAKKPKKKRKWKSAPPFVYVLCERFPALFNLEDRKPLKCGIKQDIAEVLKDDPDFNLEELDKALRWYTCGYGYVLNVTKGCRRFDLEGNKVEKISKLHQKESRQRLDRMGVVIYEKKTKEKKPKEKASDTADLPKDETAEISVPENPPADLNPE
jgi:sRNA-binding protein